MSEGRVKSSIKNSLWGIISYILITLATFVSRKIFADSLGQEYLGLEGLFTNIITMMSLSELGISTAILFFLYEPVANKKYSLVNTYLRFYRKLYNYIGGTIIALGIVIACFINYFAKTDIPLNKVRLYFMIFVLSTAFTYFLSYKRALLYADQSNRVISIVHMITKMGCIVLQMGVLIYTKNYILYLLILLFTNILENLICNYIVNKKYKFINSLEYVPITEEQKKGIFTKVKSLIIQNVSSVIVTSTDNILISTFVDVVNVGIYSNYMIISQALKTLFSQIYSAFTTSFGNLVALESKEKTYEVYQNVEFFGFWSISYCSVMYMLLIQPFIKMWMGEEYLFSFVVALLIGVSFYVYMLNVPFYSIQNAMGLHYLDQKVVVWQAVFNLMGSFVLVNTVGVVGVIIGTLLSTLLFPTISKPTIIYKNVFNKSPMIYYKKYVGYFLLMTATLFVSNFVLEYISINNMFANIVVKFFAATIIFNLIYTIIFFNRKEFKYFIEMIKNYLNKFRGV